MSFDWELYHLAEDFTQADNPVEQNPRLTRGEIGPTHS